MIWKVGYLALYTFANSLQLYRIRLKIDPQNLIYSKALLLMVYWNDFNRHLGILTGTEIVAWECHKATYHSKRKYNEGGAKIYIAW